MPGIFPGVGGAARLQTGEMLTNGLRTTPATTACSDRPPAAVLKSRFRSMSEATDDICDRFDTSEVGPEASGVTTIR